MTKKFDILEFVREAMNRDRGEVTVISSEVIKTNVPKGVVPFVLAKALLASCHGSYGAAAETLLRVHLEGRGNAA